MPVKPLNASSLSKLMERIDNAKDGLFRSITVLSPASISFRFSVQDRARGFDWIDVVFQVDGVNDAKLVSESVLESIDMSDGISIEIEAKKASIALGKYEGRMTESSLYVIGETMMYEETGFTG